jgi:hypothetical protein
MNLQISDLEHDLKVARAEASKWKEIAMQAQDELAELKKILMPAGMCVKVTFEWDIFPSSVRWET